MAKKKLEKGEPFITREDLKELRGLSKSFVKNKLGPIMYDLGHRTKLYKLSEVDNFLKQMKKAV